MEALLFQQLAYWSDKGTDPEWINKSQLDIGAESALIRPHQGFLNRPDPN